MRRLNFPVLHRLQIKHFSLYKKADFLDIDLTKNVFCLAGANGLGKSTFITIINYILTGIVKNPERSFSWYNSIPAFYNKSKGFAERYFDGRVKPDFYDIAEATLYFSIGDNYYSITRGFFEPDELRQFSKTTNGKPVVIPDNISSSDLNETYKSNFTKDINLSEFDQFVFLQSYVFTFDETHQLISWDVALIERVLYLFFGVDSNKAKLADQLRKEYNKYDSDVRNLQYQITRTRNELNDLKKRMETVNINDGSNIELYEVHKNLLEKSDELTTILKRISDDIRDVELNISDLSLKASNLRSEYSHIFNKTLKQGSPIEKHPIIIEIINDLSLRIHASRDYSDLISKLVDEIRKFQETPTNHQYFEQLQKIDSELSIVTSKIKTFQIQKDKLIQDESAHTLQLNDINNQILSIEKENEQLLRAIQKARTESDTNLVVKTYHDQIERLTAEKDEAYRRRNKARSELEPLESELNMGYVNAEKDFIPKFNQYAKSFLGLDIHIDLLFSAKGASLTIDIEEAKRKDSYQLSESQRYFIDIALRMALIDLCANSATVLIDTPEGSLDIAYESRAGKMFADFAKEFHKIIMTANINSSQLLLELASICTGERMQIERMTNWTDLSEVQQKENDKIEAAYTKIEEKLGTTHDGK
ncbi:MAG TPA: AAA family ATPase [Chitinophagaceae bacterium]|nr:AAA family ATPase [Chitinophagaceae bacterium]